MSSLIEFKNVCYKYKGYSAKPQKETLSNINLLINAGEFIAVMGNNGSGKSTFAKHLNGLLIPDSGDVFVNKMNTKNELFDFEIKKTVGMVFQNPDSQIVSSTVEEEIAFGLENLCVPSEKMPKIIECALKSVELNGFEKRSVYSLSGGQKQRLAIACVLAMNPKVIVFDEPTSMLDPESRKSVMNVIQKINRSGITIVLITHLPEEALMAQRVIILNEGKIEIEGNPAKIFSDSEFSKKHINSLPDSTKILLFLKNHGYNPSLKAFDEKNCAHEIIKLLENRND